MSAHEISKKLGTLNNCIYNITVQNGKEAGQTVPHVHLHLVPQAISGAERRKEGAEIRKEDDMAI